MRRSWFPLVLSAYVLGCSGADKPFNIKAPKQVEGHKTEGEMKGTENKSSHYIAMYDLKVSLDKSSELYITSGLESKTELCVPSSIADPGEIVWTRTEGLNEGQVTIHFHDCEPYIYRIIGKFPVNVDLSTLLPDGKKWVESAYQVRKKEIKEERAEETADMIGDVLETVLGGGSGD